MHIFGQPDICYHDSIKILKAEIAQVLIRNLDDQFKTRLQRQTKRHCHSMEAEARDILRSGLLVEETPARGLGPRICAPPAAAGRAARMKLSGHGLQGRAGLTLDAGLPALKSQTCGARFLRFRLDYTLVIALEMS